MKNLDEREYNNVYAIPANYTDSGKLLGGMIDTRNAIETVILVLALGYPELILIPMPDTIRIVVMTVTLLPLAVAPAARNDKPVSLVIDDAPVAQVLQALAEMNHKNLVVAPDVSGTLSLRLQKVPWSQALRAVADSAGLSLQQQGTVIYAHTQA